MNGKGPTVLDLKTLDARKRHGRLVNAVAAYFRRTLSVPNIYLNAKIAVGLRADVCAVDRAGSGDIHVAEIKVPHLTANLSVLNGAVRMLKAEPAHFKYLVLSANSMSAKLALQSSLFATNGIGRIGLLLVDEDVPDSVRSLVQPERFRVDSSSMEQIDQYLEQTPPDMTVRL